MLFSQPSIFSTLGQYAIPPLSKASLHNSRGSRSVPRVPGLNRIPPQLQIHMVPTKPFPSGSFLRPDLPTPPLAVDNEYLVECQSSPQGINYCSFFLSLNTYTRGIGLDLATRRYCCITPRAPRQTVLSSTPQPGATTLPMRGKPPIVNRAFNPRDFHWQGPRVSQRHPRSKDHQVLSFPKDFNLPVSFSKVPPVAYAFDVLNSLFSTITKLYKNRKQDRASTKPGWNSPPVPQSNAHIAVNRDRDSCGKCRVHA